jgi:pantoate--beta-alanine ligase
VRVIETVEALTKELEAARHVRSATVGLVPTMGALHQGHLALVERARHECDLVVLTIFVNPLQFDDDADLAGYPRDLEGDLESAHAAGVDVTFVPSVEEMFPAGASTTVSVGPIGRIFEGSHRPGHLDGVATVVSKLFAMSGPCRAYFGEKDFQQLAVVRRLAADLSFPVDVVGCATVREPDGLACSSRNARLSGREREAAAGLNRALLSGLAVLAGGERRAEIVRRAMRETVSTEPLVKLDYAVVVDTASLEEVDQMAGDVRLLMAARVGQVRLIDNMGYGID